MVWVPVKLFNDLLEFLVNHLEGIGGEHFDETVKPHAGALLKRLWVALRRQALRERAIPTWAIVAAAFVGPLVTVILPGSWRGTRPVAFALPVAFLTGLAWTAHRRHRRATADVFSSYFEDTFPEHKGIVWRWCWKPGASLDGGRDLVDSIDSLRPYCPKCGMRFVYRCTYRHVDYFEQTYESTIFVCPNRRHPPCGFQAVIDLNFTDVCSEARRIIEQKVRERVKG